MTSPYSSSLLQESDADHAVDHHPVAVSEEFPRPTVGEHADDPRIASAERDLRGEPDLRVHNHGPRVEAYAPRSSYATGAGTLPVHVQHPAHTHAFAPVPMAYPAPQQQFQPMYVDGSGSGRGSAATPALLALVVVLVGVVALAGGYLATRQAAPRSEEATATVGIAASQGFTSGRTGGRAQGYADGTAAVSTAGRLSAAAARSAAYDKAYQRGLRAGERSYRRPSSGPRYTGGYRGPSLSFPTGGGEVSSALGAAQNLANITGSPVDVDIF